MLAIVNDEKRVETAIVNTVVNSEKSIFESSSSFRRLQYAVARIFRFVSYHRSKGNSNSAQPSEPTETPSEKELKQPFFVLVKYGQKLSFPEEIQRLNSNLSINRRSRLWYLDSMVDEKGVMRVAGRLDRAPISPEKRHPIIIDSKSRFILLYAR